MSAGAVRPLRRAVDEASTAIPEEDVFLLGRLFAGNGLAAGMERAAQLLDRVGGLNAALAAPLTRLRQAGAGEEEIRLIDIVRQTMLRALRREADGRMILGSLETVVDYLHVDMAYRPVEVFRVLFLDRRNRLVHDEIMHMGTLDKVEVHPRLVVQRALEVNAAAVILSHNHPSGDPTPSRDDIQITRAISDAACCVSVMVHDHVIIGRTGHCSLRLQGLL